MANNHMCNYGKIGLDQTKKILSDNQIYWTGISDGEPIINIKNKRVGFLGFNDIGGGGCGINDAKDVSEKIQILKPQVDFVVVQFYWGVEYKSNPTARQVALAREAIGAGADLVVGNHSHWPQTTERYKDKLIVYSQGKSF
ncbi:MAG: poly-gamma-glutamate synthesis protein (capsule biosynthesis protein) [Microgenomates group bacterium Gr01-1014_16]|nr:MAG: poly-gamma-glutamate synthesis protein (capsule biosynthesis protein) [Microgenomates group bacterium Gr01-1014_16]